MADIGLDWNAPLVNRLRLAPVCLSNVGDNAAKLMNEAAEEIERLRTALREMIDEFEYCNDYGDGTQSEGRQKVLNTARGLVEQSRTEG